MPIFPACLVLFFTWTSCKLPCRYSNGTEQFGERCLTRGFLLKPRGIHKIVAGKSIEGSQSESRLLVSSFRKLPFWIIVGTRHLISFPVSMINDLAFTSGILHLRSKRTPTVSHSGKLKRYTRDSSQNWESDPVKYCAKRYEIYAPRIAHTIFSLFLSRDVQYFVR